MKGKAKSKVQKMKSERLDSGVKQDQATISNAIDTVSNSVAEKKKKRKRKYKAKKLVLNVS